MKLKKRIASLSLACVVGFSAASSVARASFGATEPQDALQATEALRQGRVLLKRGRADQALPLLENALRLYTAANAPRGEAAAHDALGDLYSRQGQYARALDHF
jgi:tetratricopeptide (TPR) repeat protein